jgi:hypothetical protein
LRKTQGDSYMDAGRRCCGHLSLCLAISLKKKRAALKEEEKRPGTKCLVKVISPSYKKKNMCCYCTGARLLVGYVSRAKVKSSLTPFVSFLPAEEEEETLELLDLGH